MQSSVVGTLKQEHDIHEVKLTKPIVSLAAYVSVLYFNYSGWKPSQDDQEIKKLLSKTLKVLKANLKKYILHQGQYYHYKHRKPTELFWSFCEAGPQKLSDYRDNLLVLPSCEERQ